MRMLLILSLVATGIAQEPLTVVSPNPVDRQVLLTLRSEIETLNAKMRAVQAEMEVIRLRSCMAANVPLPKCGQWTQDGKIPQLHDSSTTTP